MNHPLALLTKLFIRISLLLAIASCSDHRPPPVSVNNLRLKTSLYLSATASTKATYFYNSKNKLDHIDLIYRFASGSVTPTTIQFFYDSQDRLIKTEKKDPLDMYTRVFNYDYRGDLVLLQLYRSRLERQWAYRYDNNHRPVEETITIVGSPVNSVSQYSYSNGNVSQAIVSFFDGSETTTTTTTYQYDDKPNPFRNLFGVENEVFNLDGKVYRGFSRNNVLLPNETLTYNDQGLVVENVYYLLLQIRATRSISYTYESY